MQSSFMEHSHVLCTVQGLGSRVNTYEQIPCLKKGKDPIPSLQGVLPEWNSAASELTF